MGETGPNDILLETIHPTGYLVNKGFMNSLSYKQAKNFGTIFFEKELTSYYKTIESDYTFIL